jgi:large subunit ribosomal protein L18
VNHDKANYQLRRRRRFRVRKRIEGSSDRPRLSVFRSGGHIYAQLIDDSQGRTIASASSRDKQLRSAVANGGNKEGAQAVGKAIAERAKAAGVARAAFDRGSYKYHGRVAALADAAREGGLEF